MVLSGGDPLAREDVVQLVEYSDEIGLRMTLTPSGTSSLTSGRVEELADAGLRRMALSIDGATAEAHDDFRGEEGSFDETLGAADHARETGIPLQVNTTVCRGTVDELGAVLWSVFFLVPVGRGALLEGIGPERAETVMECPHEVQNEASFGVKTTEAPHYRRVIAQRKRDSEEREATADGGFRRRAGVKAGEGFAFVSHTANSTPRDSSPYRLGTSARRALSCSTGTPRCSSDYAIPTNSRGSAVRASSANSAVGVGRVLTRRWVTRSKATICATTFPKGTTVRSPGARLSPNIFGGIRTVAPRVVEAWT